MTNSLFIKFAKPISTHVTKLGFSIELCSRQMIMIIPTITIISRVKKFNIYLSKWLNGYLSLLHLTSWATMLKICVFTKHASLHKYVYYTINWFYWRPHNIQSAFEKYLATKFNIATEKSIEICTAICELVCVMVSVAMRQIVDS